MAAPHAWPRSLLDDSDVLRLDEKGHFVVCRLCCLNYAVYGGLEAEHVDMGLPFFTHQWREHKRLQHSELTTQDNRIKGKATPPPPPLVCEPITHRFRLDPAMRRVAREASEQNDSGLTTGCSDSESSTSSVATSKAFSRKRCHVDSTDSATQRRPESPTRRGTALYWRTLRAVYASPSPICSRPDSCTELVQNRSDSPVPSRGLANRKLINVMDELTKALVMREGLRKADDSMLLTATAALTAIRSDRRQAFELMIQSQERNLERMRALIVRPSEVD